MPAKKVRMGYSPKIRRNQGSLWLVSWRKPSMRSAAEKPLPDHQLLDDTLVGCRASTGSPLRAVYRPVKVHVLSRTSQRSWREPKSQKPADCQCTKPTSQDEECDAKQPLAIQTCLAHTKVHNCNAATQTLFDPLDQNQLSNVLDSNSGGMVDEQPSKTPEEYLQEARQQLQNRDDEIRLLKQKMQVTRVAHKEEVSVKEQQLYLVAEMHKQNTGSLMQMVKNLEAKNRRLEAKFVTVNDELTNLRKEHTELEEEKHEESMYSALFINKLQEKLDALKLLCTQHHISEDIIRDRMSQC